MHPATLSLLKVRNLCDRAIKARFEADPDDPQVAGATMIDVADTYRQIQLPSRMKQPCTGQS